MSATAGPSVAPTRDVGEIYNWTELLHFFNHTLPECHMELNENTKRVALFVLYLAIFVVGLVENLLVICVNWRGSARAGLLRLYVLNMAIADLGIILSLPVWMLEATLDYTWLWGSFSCRFTHYFYYANMYSSIFFLVCLSVDRYVTLTNASTSWQRHQHRGRRAVCAGVWVLSALIPLPEVVHIRLVDSFEPMCLFMAPFETYSTWATVVALSTTVLGFLLPLPLIAVFNVLTARRLRQTGQPEGRRHCLLVCAYIAVFVICWLPYHMLHCVVNPILYNFLSPSFRGRLLNAVVHYLPKVQVREGRHASTTSSSSSTQHSIIITKEGTQPPAAGPHQHPSLNFQAANTLPTSAPQSLVAS
ncbi:PREDICTED: G-protein coupled receptor 182 [Bison bison bison]|uniref:G-protein coupled receptor 182 n=1 Tax=Bison bison bison TaxID=43346 RepID=A0A6P3H6P6_BISBB|nr:PREDICTED: G-protein coupled receptor 182 [Bison bison bison]